MSDTTPTTSTGSAKTPKKATTAGRKSVAGAHVVLDATGILLSVHADEAAANSHALHLIGATRDPEISVRYLAWNQRTDD